MRCLVECPASYGNMSGDLLHVELLRATSLSLCPFSFSSLFPLLKRASCNTKQLKTKPVLWCWAWAMFLVESDMTCVRMLVAFARTGD